MRLWLILQCIMLLSGAAASAESIPPAVSDIIHCYEAFQLEDYLEIRDTPGGDWAFTLIKNKKCGCCLACTGRMTLGSIPSIRMPPFPKSTFQHF